MDKEEKEIKKKVKPFTNTGHVTLPKKWIGQFVKISLLEEKDEK